MKSIHRHLHIILAAIAVIACSQPSQAQIFYKVTAPDSDRPSYILGSHHLAPLSVIDSIPGLSSALSSVDALIGEINTSSLSSPNEMQDIMRVMTAPPDSTLDKVLSPDELDRLAQAFSRYSSPVLSAAPQMLHPMKPAVVDNLLAQLISSSVCGDIPSENIDMAMQSRARDLGIQILPLETALEQAQLLYGTPIPSQAQALIATIDHLDIIEEQIAALSKAYADRDITAILDAMHQSFDDDPASFRRLVSDRNAAWLPILIAEMHRRPVMIVVGAAHLPGSDGLIEGLRGAGFTVIPL